MQTTQANTTVIPTTEEISMPDFGKGRYSPLMEEVWKDAQAIFRFRSVEAEQLARKVASDLGRIMSNAPVEIKLSGVNKDGKITIREAAKLKNITITNSLTLLKAINFANEAMANGFSRNKTEWCMNDTCLKAWNNLTVD